MTPAEVVQLGRPAIAVIMTLLEGEDRSINHQLLAEATADPALFAELFSGMTHLAGRLAVDLADATGSTPQEVLRELALRAEW